MCVRRRDSVASPTSLFPPHPPLTSISFTTMVPSFPHFQHTHLSQYGEVRLVGSQRQHDQVRIQPVDHVARVWLEAGAPALRADVLHDLVLALAGDGRV